MLSYPVASVTESATPQSEILNDMIIPKLPTRDWIMLQSDSGVMGT